MRHASRWCQAALLQDDLFLRVVLAAFGLAVLMGCGFALRAFFAEMPGRADVPIAIIVGALLLVLAGMGTVLGAAAFLPPASRLWRWSQAFDPTSGASCLDELAIILVVLLIVLALLIIPTLLLRACGVSGHAWGASPS